jgi:hypothetical protein
MGATRLTGIGEVALINVFHPLFDVNSDFSGSAKENHLPSQALNR